MALVGDHHVVRADVAVDDVERPAVRVAQLVRGVKPVARLGEHARHERRSSGAPRPLARGAGRARAARPPRTPSRERAPLRPRRTRTRARRWGARAARRAAPRGGTSPRAARRAPLRAEALEGDDALEPARAPLEGDLDAPHATPPMTKSDRYLSSTPPGRAGRLAAAPAPEAAPEKVGAEGAGSPSRALYRTLCSRGTRGVPRVRVDHTASSVRAAAVALGATGCVGASRSPSHASPTSLPTARRLPPPGAATGTSILSPARSAIRVRRRWTRRPAGAARAARSSAPASNGPATITAISSPQPPPRRSRRTIHRCANLRTSTTS